MKKETMEIVFGGESKQVNANTLIVALGHYQTVMSEANKELGATKTVELKVNALKEGSFIVDVSIVESALKQIFSGESMEYLANVCGIVGGVYATYKVLKGKSARTDEQKDKIRTIIKGDNNVVFNGVINVYNQVATREAISKTIEAASEDPNVTGFAVEAQGNKTVFERKDFQEYIHRSFDEEDLLPPEKIFTEKAILTIVSLSFESGNSWVFMYKGFKINVRVKDNILMELIDQGERFEKGDSIEVELEVTQKYNPNYRAYENKGYRILRFFRHNEAPAQESLFE